MAAPAAAAAAPLPPDPERDSLAAELHAPVCVLSGEPSAESMPLWADPARGSVQDHRHDLAPPFADKAVLRRPPPARHLERAAGGYAQGDSCARAAQASSQFSLFSLQVCDVLIFALVATSMLESQTFVFLWEGATATHGLQHVHPGRAPRANTRKQLQVTLAKGRSNAYVLTSTTSTVTLYFCNLFTLHTHAFPLRINWVCVRDTCAARRGIPYDRMYRAIHAPSTA
jgi:hypothetical protein